MFPAVLCILLVMVPSLCLAEPLRREATHICRLGQIPMPDLHKRHLRTASEISVPGRAIKGLYYSNTPTGPNTLLAFYVGCRTTLEPNPFLVIDFEETRAYLDQDRDGCGDRVEPFLARDVDPADYYPMVDGADDLCFEDQVSRLEDVQKVLAIRGGQRLEFPDFDAAEREAAEAAASISRDLLPRGVARDVTVEVRNEHSQRLLTIRVTKAGTSACGNL